MSDYIKVKDHPDLVRDKRSGAILNTNKSELDKYIEKRDLLIKQKAMIAEHDTMKADIEDIKAKIDLLVSLLTEKATKT